MRRRERLVNVALLVVATLGTLAALEAFCAFAYRPPRHPMFDTSTWTTALARDRAVTPPLNAKGFRQVDPGPDAFAPGTTRVLVLGDSYTFGFGVDDGHARFTDRIEAALNADLAPRRFHVYNAGVTGTKPTAWVGYLEELLPEYRPALVLAVFSLRDGSGVVTSLAFYQAKMDELRARYTDNAWYRRSYLARWVLDRVMLAAFNRYHHDLLRTAYVGTEAEQAPWRREQDALRRIAAICAAHGVPFHLVVFPLLFDLRHYPFDDVERAILGFAGANGIPAVSLIDGFRDRDETTLWAGPYDQHPNALGHEIAADTLYPYVKRSLPPP